MNLHIHISALPVKGGGFLPKFQFMEFDGNRVSTIPYDFENESVKPTKEEELEVAKNVAIRIGKEIYHPDVQVFFNED